MNPQKVEGGIQNEQNDESITKNGLIMEEKIIKSSNIECVDAQGNQEKENNNVFPNFILANKAEELKKNKPMMMSNSIIYEGNNSMFVNINNHKSIFSTDDIKADIKNEQEIGMTNYKPHIFQDRPCTTCNIIRPEKSSHCVICNNCIFELDHHCFYISNCVGKRNRKFFVLFLIYGVLLSLLCLITSCYHLIYTFYIQPKYKYLNLSLIRNFLVIVIISVVIMAIGTIILFIKKDSIKYSAVIFAVGDVAFNVVFFYKKKKNQKNEKKIFDINYHPFSICLIYMILPLLIIVVRYLRKQIKLIGKGLTTKQYVSIREERNANKNNKNIYNYLDSILKRKIRLTNFFYFLMQKQTKSLVNM